MSWRSLCFRLLFLSFLGTVFGSRSDAAESWVPTATPGAPAGRYQHVAVWTGDRMIVWGGIRANGTVLGDGAIYDPAAKTWTPISPRGAPSARALATAVWTGDRMLVWGGFRLPSTVLGDGAAYDPATDTWSPLSTAGAPSSRYFHTAVWTGTEMLIWGGYADFEAGKRPTAFATGAAYDPATNAWRPTSTDDAPSARGAQVAVWTGDRMIVWGGSSGHAAIAGGGLYDPQADTWTATSDGEPSGRVSHAGIWDGTHFLVWGGLLDDGSDTNTGGIFDPVEIAWAAIPTAGAPSARDAHAAETLGRRLVVWSGEKGVVPTATGAIFDPRTGTWTPTTLVGAPAARSGASVVSTGHSLIFWGGISGASAFNTGGEYFPPFCTGGDHGCVLNVSEPVPAAVEGRH